MILNLLRNIGNLFTNRNDDVDDDLAEIVSERQNQEIWIALAGKTGAGKSTLINLLFNPKPKLKVGMGRPGTMEPTTRVLQLRDDKGTIKYTDLPGIGESRKYKKTIESANIEHFEKCDLILWLFRADDTAKEIEEEFFEKLPERLKRKIIFGLSRCDNADGGNWYNKGNKPSKGQQEYILNRIKNLSETFNIHEDEIIEFSTQKKYNVNYLVNHMITSTKNKADILRYKMVETI